MHCSERFCSLRTLKNIENCCDAIVFVSVRNLFDLLLVNQLVIFVGEYYAQHSKLEIAVLCLDNIYSAKTLFANFLLSIAVKEWNKAENHVEAIEQQVEDKITFDNPQQWSPS